MSAIDWLIVERSVITEEDIIYDINSVYKNKNLKVIELIPKRAWLVVYEDETSWVKFATLEFHSSEIDESNLKASVIFHGEGSGGNLRECRHTYWGECSDGYLFYPNGKAIALAFKELSNYFDDML